MSAERLLALPEAIETGPKKSVTSETFLRYLLPNMPLVPGSEFAYHFDLGFLEKSMGELYDHDKQDSILNDTGRKKLEEKKEIDKMLNQTAKVERAREFFYDPKDRRLKVSGITEGTYNLVRSDLPNITSQGKIPLLSMHTHPINVLFSAKDYMRLIVNPGTGQERFVRGTIVLCPDIQIMALATSLTPSLDDDQKIEEFEQFWQHDGVKDEVTEYREKRLEKIKNLSSKYGEVMIKNFQQQNSAIDELYDLSKAGDISSWEAEELIKNVIESGLARSEKTYERFATAGSAVLTRLDNKLEWLENRINVDLARSVGVQLYTSTDRKNFYAATA